jgi:protein-disulfide isomerase
MKLVTAFGLAAAFIGVACMAAPVSADEFTPAQKQELGAFIKSYLVNNPEVLREAIEALDKHDKETADAERQKVVATQSSALFSSKYQATVGNPQGGATLVEFFDYNCHFCKGALPDVTKLMKDDPNLKLVLKDYPVLGPGSVEAAKVASAARNQLPGDKFWAFHSKLLATHAWARSCNSPTLSRSTARPLSSSARTSSLARSVTTSSKIRSTPCTSAGTPPADSQALAR